MRLDEGETACALVLCQRQAASSLVKLLLSAGA